MQIAMFLVLVTIHFGLLIGGYRHPAAGTTESVIAVILVSRTILDLSLNVILLLTLIAGLALTKRGAGHEQPAWMAALAKQTQPPGPRMSDSGR